MVDKGLVEEARRVYPYRHLNSLNTVGYKEMFDYLDGLTTLEECVARIQSNTRRYMRKQETWKRRSLDIISSVKVKQQNLSIFRDLKGTLKIIQFIGIWF